MIRVDTTILKVGGTSWLLYINVYEVRYTYIDSSTLWIQQRENQFAGMKNWSCRVDDKAIKTNSSIPQRDQDIVSCTIKSQLKPKINSPRQLNLIKIYIFFLLKTCSRNIFNMRKVQNRHIFTMKNFIPYDKLKNISKSMKTIHCRVYCRVSQNYIMIS